MGAIRTRTMRERDHMKCSPPAHLRILEAPEARDSDGRDHHARQHGLNLATHLERFVDYLEYAGTGERSRSAGLAVAGSFQQEP